MVLDMCFLVSVLQANADAVNVAMVKSNTNALYLSSGSASSRTIIRCSRMTFLGPDSWGSISRFNLMLKASGISISESLISSSGTSMILKRSCTSGGMVSGVLSLKIVMPSKFLVPRTGLCCNRKCAIVDPMGEPEVSVRKRQKIV